MNLRTKMNDALTDIRHLEGAYLDRVKLGSKDMSDYMEVQYLSGLRNGFGFALRVFGSKIEEEEFDKVLKGLLHQDEVN